ncbi:60S acidic ribosomal protein P1-like [Argonauta hians]
MASNNELACVYAALILADDQVTVTADKISTILKAANVAVEPYWPSLFARALDGVDIKGMLSNVGSMAAAPAAGQAAAAPAGDAGAPAKEEKKEEKKEESEESDDDMGFGLFD